MHSTRGVSSVIGVVLLVAVVVILAAAVGTFALEFTNATQEPAPQVANAEAEFLVTGGFDQTVRITHRGGDTVDVSDLEIVVSFSASSKRSRLVGAPTDKIGTGDFEGDDIWSFGFGGIGGELETGDGQWSSGEAIEFRIASGDVDVKPGEKVFVKVIHEPTESVLIDRTLTASAGSLAPVDALALVAPPTSGAASWPLVGARVVTSG
jgi:flagellin-like protein